MNAMFPTGIEIETGAQNNGAEIVLPATFTQGVDSSCGLEFRSSKLTTVEELSDVPKVCRAVYAAGCRITPKCGLHVHIGFKHIGDLSAKYRLLRFASCYEDLLLKILPPWEDRAYYCCKLPQEAWASFQQGRGFNFWEDDSRRYWWLNGAAMFKHGTVEFRHLNGTLDADDILGWVAVLQCMFHSVTAHFTRLEWHDKARSVSDLIRDLNTDSNKMFGQQAKDFITRHTNV